jgi:hypothetical protein
MLKFLLQISLTNKPDSRNYGFGSGSNIFPQSRSGAIFLNPDSIWMQYRSKSKSLVLIQIHNGPFFIKLKKILNRTFFLLISSGSGSGIKIQKPDPDSQHSPKHSPTFTSKSSQHHWNCRMHQAHLAPLAQKAANWEKKKYFCKFKTTNNIKPKWFIEKWKKMGKICTLN